MATYEATRYSTTGANIPTNTIPATSIVDGTVSNAEFAFINTLSSNAQTQINTKIGASGGTLTGNLDFNDDVKTRWGTDNDLEIYHDDSNAYIKNGAGYLKILEDNVEFKNNADSTTFMSLSSTGVSATTVDATTLKQGGTALATIATSGSATNLAAGTVPDARFPATLPAASGVNLTALNASNLGSGTVPDARLPASALTSDYVKLARVSGTGVSSLGFLGSPSGFSSDYRHYKVILDGKWQNADNASTYIGMRISTDSSAYLSTSIYSSSQIFGMTNANNWTYTYQGSVFYVNRWPPYSTQGSRSAACEITIFGAHEASHKTVASLGGSWDRNQNGASWQSSGGVIETTDGIFGIQLFMTDGANITGPSGATLYGIK